ncbi:MAG: endonuclease, partial [Candidatus Riflebacteria bacterium]
KTPEQLFNKILQQVDDIEQKSPQLQAEIFKLRSSLDELYTGLTSGSLTDPTDAKGKHVVIDLQRGADLYDPCQGQEDEDLIVSLRRIAESSHTPIGYQTAQDKIFTVLDNRDGWVECVYTGRKLKTNCEPDASNMNVEHTWPQSLGATGIAKSDLHHLFPSDSKANGIRGNNPFAFVSSPEWEQGGSKSGNRSFEVRPKQRGDTARGMFYFSVRYNKRIDPRQEEVLKKWHREDPVDEDEKARNDRIENIQHNRNPFVDRPDFVDQISDF